MRPVFFCKCRKFCTVCRIGFLFGKVYVVQQGLDVKSGSAGDNRNLSGGIDLLQGLFCHLLKTDNIKLFGRL